MLYMLIQIVAQGVPGSMLPTLRDSPLAEVEKAAFGPIGYIRITVGAAISIFGSLSGGMLSNPRVILGHQSIGLSPSLFLPEFPRDLIHSIRQ